MIFLHYYSFVQGSNQSWKLLVLKTKLLLFSSHSYCNSNHHQAHRHWTVSFTPFHLLSLRFTLERNIRCWLSNWWAYTCGSLVTISESRLLNSRVSVYWYSIIVPNWIGYLSGVWVIRCTEWRSYSRNLSLEFPVRDGPCSVPHFCSFAVNWPRIRTDWPVLWTICFVSNPAVRWLICSYISHLFSSSFLVLVSRKCEICSDHSTLFPDPGRHRHILSSHFFNKATSHRHSF